MRWRLFGLAVVAALASVGLWAWGVASPAPRAGDPPSTFVPSYAVVPPATHPVRLRPPTLRDRRLRMLMDHLPAPPRGELRVAASIAPRPTTTAAPTTTTVVSDATSTDTRDWSCIRWYESTDDYAAPGGGAYQFEDFVWTEFSGLPAPAEDYSPAVQDATALKLYAYDLRVWGDGFEAWTTRYVCGL